MGRTGKKVNTSRYVPVSWADAMQEFVFCKKAEGRAPRTLKDYEFHITAFFRNNEEAWPSYEKLRLAVRRHFAEISEFSKATYNLRRQNLILSHSNSSS